MTCSIALRSSGVSSVSGSGCPNISGIVFCNIPCGKSFEIICLSFPHKAFKAKWLNQYWCLPGGNQLCYRLACNRTQFEATCSMPGCQDHILPAGRHTENWVRVLRPWTKTRPDIRDLGVFKFGH